ncbi:MAG: FtsH protease activity modulator HflK [Bacteroidales bacterium]|nr:FtsH protease activity modulator HflK [Bacteroidales bacterium]MCB9028414.1 FtsH protease activity modulator HflK [Bacteroidales bacterium]HPJ04902.1 FtsH protease activity modulator HflK [Bacteroidales bacterium]HRW27522.1 FtsH protease activity modulator HflK [Bacteroidales bacterium]
MGKSGHRAWIDKNRLYLKYGLIGLFIIILLATSLFQVQPEEVGIITRFGKYVRKVEPGLNLKVPIIERLYKVAVERQQKEEFGFRTTSAGVRSEYTKQGTADESLMLTGDLNLADVEWVVQYRIEDPYSFLFKVREPVVALRDISEASMREIVGDRTVNEVLTVGRAEIASSVHQKIQQLCSEYSLGIRIEQVVLQDVNPPDPVKDAFNDVNQAQQERETLINQARSEYNKVIPKAKGQAEETIQRAEGYATERVNNALGEATRFNALYLEYIKAPEVTKRRIYLETMEEILPKAGNKILTDESGNNLLPLLQMQLTSKK